MEQTAQQHRRGNWHQDDANDRRHKGEDVEEEIEGQ
jgi:hypothetical protein